MSRFISIQQQQMLEDLTGLQHTRTGQVRQKQNRSELQSRRLGLVTPKERSWQEIKRMLLSRRPSSSGE